uniref:Ubiquitin-like domain-containing protein n=1 Tax=Eutreptiella gymnastica TaxID=73025 RepID=A0A7S1IV32_9EUGL|mmetsp:Transcript_4398/g.7749  ORF Transcript_4398/g.7749 Transcript_4398/m.7749 type:complete len:310 (+) Transcript_4398:23-952(+)
MSELRVHGPRATHALAPPAEWPGLRLINTLARLDGQVHALAETLSRRRTAFREALSEVAALNEAQLEVYRLDVGGRAFHTRVEVLQRKEGPLSMMASEVFATDVDEDGYAFLDRDPAWFPLVLHSLRAGVALLPEDAEGRQAVFREARYYNLDLDVISLVVISPEGDELRCGFKVSIPLSKLMDEYCSQKGLKRTRVRFRFDGRLLRYDNTLTAADYGMEDDDRIHAFCACPNEVISLVVISPGGDELWFKIKLKTPLRKLMRAFCNKKGLESTAVQFYFNGRFLHYDQNLTAEDYEMGYDDVIRAIHV